MTTMIPLVQGLVQQKLIAPDPRWYQNGQVVCNQAFGAWWRDNKGLSIANLSNGGSPEQLDDLYLRTVQWMGMQQQVFGTAGK